MDIKWRISKDDVSRVRRFVQKHESNALVRARKAQNVAPEKQKVRRQQFWFGMVGTRLTSMQRSGPESHVARFIRTNPFPVGYEDLRVRRNVEASISTALKRAGGIRFVDRIARDLSQNLERLEEGEWSEAIRQCNRLTGQTTRALEREVATYIDSFTGFGPKQSRNLLQMLGLTRYEVPIDSRVTDWLNEFGFPVPLSATALADGNYYDFVSDGIQALCASAKILPCVFDAAIFSSKDGSTWTEENTIY